MEQILKIFDNSSTDKIILLIMLIAVFGVIKTLLGFVKIGSSVINDSKSNTAEMKKLTDSIVNLVARSDLQSEHNAENIKETKDSIRRIHNRLDEQGNGTRIIEWTTMR